MVGEVEVDAVWSVAAEASRKLGIEVNPVIRTPQEWEAEHTGFAEAVEHGAKIPLGSHEGAIGPRTAPIPSAASRLVAVARGGLQPKQHA